jgi:hypothetical protein
MNSIIYVDSVEAQEKMVKMIRSMIAAGIMTDIPRIVIPMIELSPIKQTKSAVITATCRSCSSGKKEE